MNNQEAEQRRHAVREFRYGVIAELCNPYLSKEQGLKMIREKASREYEIPYSSKKRITPSCIKKWRASFYKIFPCEYMEVFT